MTNHVLSERELKVMRAVAHFPHGASLDDISARCGYRPARSGRLAVRKVLRSLLLRNDSEYQRGYHGECGGFVGRMPPKDQWDCEKWFLTDAAKRICGETPLGERGDRAEQN